MEITLYDSVFIILSLFDAYIIYLFMTCFFDGRVTSKITEVLSYLGYFVLIVLVYWFMNTPLSFLISNPVAYIMISYNYKGSVRKKVISSLLIYCILFCAEILTLLILAGITQFDIFETNVTLPVLSLISVKIFSFILALVIKNFKNMKKGDDLNIANWISILVMPLGALLTMLIVVSVPGIKYEYMILIVVTLLLMNFTAFYLFDAITKSSEEKLKNAVFQEKNLYYGAQLDLIKSSFKALKMFKHDINNHLTVLEAILNSGDEEHARKYMKELKIACKVEQEFVNTGNISIDSIINFKLNIAPEIEKRLNINLPENLNVDAYDMVCILGNLLDNGIRGALEAEKKFIDISLKYEKKRLLIKIDNSYSGEILKHAGKIKTSKDDKENHGLGLERVQDLVNKNNGDFDIIHGDNIFSVLVIYNLNLEL